MEYVKISFDSIRGEIEEIFLGSKTNPEYLDPISVLNCAESVGIKLPISLIDDWESYEYGNIDISDEEFFIKLFNTLEPELGQAIVVTDHCFKEKQGYLISEGNLFRFVTEVYPDLHGEAFFQIFDILFIFPEKKSLVCIHHEGRIIEFGEVKKTLANTV